MLAITGKENTVYAGHQGGVIKVGFLRPLSLFTELTPSRRADLGSRYIHLRQNTEASRGMLPPLPVLRLTLTIGLGQHDILTLTLLGTSLYSGAANGTLQRWNKAFNLVHTWPAHDDIVLASTSTQEGGRRLLTGGNDATLKVG